LPTKREGKMKSRFLMATAIALVLLSLPALVLAQPPIVPSTGPSGDGAGVAPLGSPDVLWDQPHPDLPHLASQYFPTFSCGFYSADDFSNAQPWNIESIFIPGSANNATGLWTGLWDAYALYWAIYPDAGGQPAGYPDIGGELWSYSCSPFDPEVTLGGANLTDITLDIVQAQGTPLYLPPGTYWLCFFPVLDFFSYGQWFWGQAGTTNLAVAHAIDPCGLIGTWYSWTPWSVSDPSRYDLAFRIEGTEERWFDFGDAPEGALAYPSTGVTGAFPTCMNVTIAGWVQHDNFGTWFGPSFDLEPDGNAGLCPGFAPYDNDECFGDGDAGLIMPEPYTIRGGIVVPCGISQYKPYEPCEYVICLADSYGDGWNGGTVDVFVNGNPVYTGLTLAGGYGPECHPIPVENGDEITVYWTGGVWPYENAYYIYDSQGVLVRSEGTGGYDPGDVLPGQLYAAGCPGAMEVAPLGNPCGWARWGSDIDILIHNWMPNHEPYLPGYVNVLIDWNQDGQWQNNPATMCDGTTIPEHVLVDFVIPPQYDGTLSALGPPSFQIGPNDGYVWARFSITERPVGSNWTGEGTFEDGETEDYLLRVYVPPPVGGEAYPVSKASLLAPWIALGVVLAGGISWYVLRRRNARI
jgi:hypothetical protein